jgi:hypothetical protein
MSHQFQPATISFNSKARLACRVLAVEGEGANTVWHLLAYDDFFPDIESAELVKQFQALPVMKPYGANQSSFQRAYCASWESARQRRWLIEYKWLGRPRRLSRSACSCSVFANIRVTAWRN